MVFGTSLILAFFSEKHYVLVLMAFTSRVPRLCPGAGESPRLGLRTAFSNTFLSLKLALKVVSKSTHNLGDGTDCFTALAQPLWGRSKLLTPKVRTTVTARPFDRAKARIASTAQGPKLHLPRFHTKIF